MATNIDISLKRFNGTDYDTILPKTHLGQLYTDSTLVTALSAYFGITGTETTTYITEVLKKGLANGIASLDENAKIPYAQLPGSILGGLKFVAALNTNTDLDTLGATFTTDTDAIGSYWIATADIDLTSTANSTVLAPGDEGDFDLTDGIALEAGDWIIVTDWAEGVYTFGIINNTYQDAGNDAKGIVTLSSATDTTGTTSKVITEGILGGLVATDEGDMSGTNGEFADIGTNLIAPARHTHDQRYYTKAGINELFAGTTDITGYNNDNWDLAYTWGNHADEGYLTDESLADLTDVTLTSIAENHLLRYNGTNWVNDSTFKPILSAASFTTGDGLATITGTLCIEGVTA